MDSIPSVRATARSSTFAFVCLGGAVVALALAVQNEPSVAAATNHDRSDSDRDGLSDLQELVIGTLPYRADTDGDSYSDLEERARASDPDDPASVPEPAQFGLGSCASQEDGFVTVLSAVYVHDAPLDSIQLRIGIVYQGRALTFTPGSLAYSRGYLYDGRDARDTLAVVEVGVPETLLSRLGQVNMFSILRGTLPGSEDPIVSLMPLVDFSGVAMSIEQPAASLSNGGSGATGVIYRPLAADDQIPSTWNSGEICFQHTTAVGMKGVSIVHEVDSSDCLEMDTYCSPGDCAAGVGGPLELPDPAALTGG